MHSHLTPRIKEVLLRLEEDIMSETATKEAASLLAGIYVEALESENTLQILTVHKTIERRLVELKTLHGQRKICSLLIELFSRHLSESHSTVCELSDPDVDIELSAKLFETLREITSQLSTLRLHRSKDVHTASRSSTTVETPSDILNVKRREAFDDLLASSIDAAIVEYYIELANDLPQRSGNKEFFKRSKEAFLDKGLMQR